MLPMDLAPRDGTMLRLLVRFDGTSFEDSDEPCWTIGFNNLANTEEDRWQFAGWSWTHDVIVEGAGKPIGWLPMLSAVEAEQIDEAQDPVMCPCGQRTERTCSEAGFDRLPACTVPDER